MPHEESPEDAIADLIAAPATRPTKCVSCNLGRAEESNRAMTAFAAAKASGETTQDWRALHKFLVEKYGYTPTVDSMRRHMRYCLELT